MLAVRVGEPAPQSGHSCLGEEGGEPDMVVDAEVVGDSGGRPTGVVGTVGCAGVAVGLPVMGAWLADTMGRAVGGVATAAMLLCVLDE